MPGSLQARNRLLCRTNVWFTTENLVQSRQPESLLSACPVSIPTPHLLSGDCRWRRKACPVSSERSPWDREDLSALQMGAYGLRTSGINMIPVAAPQGACSVIL